MNYYDIHCTPVLCVHSFNRNLQKPKTMTLNLIARKNLFRLSVFCKHRADYACRRGHNTSARFFLFAWEKLLDTRDKLR
jgi:hypothetical protein